MDDYQDVPLEKIAEAFHDFGERQCKDASPFYSALSRKVAEASELMRLASYTRRGQPIQNMLFAAVHYLLLKGGSPELAAYYPSINPDPQAGDPFPLFRAFCHDYAEPIRDLLVSRNVQTNEVGRCACLLPAFNTVTQANDNQPLALIEVGTSAGLNLLWDHYFYTYSDGRTRGDSTSDVRLECNTIGDIPLPLPDQLPDIAFRRGVDLSPIDVQNDEAVMWLRALVWPDQTHRLKRLQHAIAVARQHPPEIVTGNALQVLPELLKSTPSDTTLCIYHSFALNQFTREARIAFYQILSDYSQIRSVYCLGMEWIGTPTSELNLNVYQNDLRTDLLLAKCEPHGRWIEWKAFNLV